MKTWVNALSVLSLAAWLAACATSPPRPVTGAVGPAPIDSPGASSNGFLRVYTTRVRSTSPPQESFFSNAPYGVPYEPAHTPYMIYRDGKVYRLVQNARNLADPTPSEVALPPGSYKIQAESSKGIVELTVVIQPGQVTVANLQGNWKPLVAGTSSEQFVWLDGTAVGWRAPTSPQPTGR